jgi:putative hydrolases of HD superfamily
LISVREIIQRSEREGRYAARQKGSHKIYNHSQKPELRIVLPAHEMNKEPSIGVLAVIFRDNIIISLNMEKQITSILKVLTLAERLKFELRHSYTSNGRQESVAEHTWRMSLMAVLIEPLLKQKVDTARLLKMIILHDLVEAEATDISALDVLRNPEIKIDKIEREKGAIENLRSALQETNGQEIYDLFYEFENKETYESKVANALDKLEVQLQHNHADFSTWEEIEYDMSYMMDKHVLFDPTLFELKTQIENEATEKMQSNGIETVLVKQRVSGTMQ